MVAVELLLLCPAIERKDSFRSRNEGLGFI